MILPWKNHHKTIKTHEYFPINTTIHRDCTAMFDSRMVPPVKSVALATKEANYLHGLPAKKLGMFCTPIPTIWILSMPQLGDIEVRKRPGEWTSAWWYYRSCQVSIWAVVGLCTLSLDVSKHKKGIAFLHAFGRISAKTLWIFDILFWVPM